MRADGTSSRWRWRSFPPGSRARSSSRGFLRDLTQEKHAERLAAARHETTRTLVETSTIAEAAPRLLAVIVGGLLWDEGALRLLDEKGLRRRVASWSAARRPSSLPDRRRGHPAPTRASPAAPSPAASPRGWRRGRAEERRWPFPSAWAHATAGVIELGSRGPRVARRERAPEPGRAVSGQVGLFLERQRAEEALRESEARISRIADAIPGAVYQYRLGADGAREHSFHEPGRARASRHRGGAAARSSRGLGARRRPSTSAPCGPRSRPPRPGSRPGTMRSRSRRGMGGASGSAGRRFPRAATTAPRSGTGSSWTSPRRRPRRRPCAA